jgi:hypothetical protein
MQLLSDVVGQADTLCLRQKPRNMINDWPLAESLGKIKTLTAVAKPMPDYFHLVMVRDPAGTDRFFHKECEIIDGTEQHGGHKSLI